MTSGGGGGAATGSPPTPFVGAGRAGRGNRTICQVNDPGSGASW
jgi:hypothetical protein